MMSFLDVSGVPHPPVSVFRLFVCFHGQHQYIHTLMEHEAQVFVLDKKHPHFSIMYCNDLGRIQMSVNQVTLIITLASRVGKKHKTWISEEILCRAVGVLCVVVVFFSSPNEEYNSFGYIITTCWFKLDWGGRCEECREGKVDADSHLETHFHRVWCKRAIAVVFFSHSNTKIL